MKNIVIESVFEDNKIYALGLYTSVTDILLASIININAQVNLHFNQNVEIPPLKKDSSTSIVPSFIDQISNEKQLILLQLKSLQIPFFPKVKTNFDFLLVSNAPLVELKNKLKKSEIQMIIDVEEQTLKPRRLFLESLFS